jgi:endonuclease/exonuclease/phosphatase family metal-dependent hydrolase
MSLWSPAARDASRARITPKTAPRTELPQKPAPAPKPSPARLRQLVDSFTPSAPPGRGPAKKPELNPQPVRTGFDAPIPPSRLPDNKRGTGIITLNTATGAGAEYNSAENRRAQAELLRESGASIVAFQEVDVNVERSKREEDGPFPADRNTALDIVAQVDPNFGVFLRDGARRVDIHDPSPPPTAVRAGEDGTTLYQTPTGVLVTSEAFSGDDRWSDGGIAGDTGADASYGNATYVAAPERVTEAYTVALPNVPTVGASGAATPEQLRALADGNLTPEERAELGVNNEALRDSKGPEPRGALVTRVVGPDGKERTIINVHVAAGEGNKALRDAQLAYIAQLAAAESKGPPAREVVVMGDLNTSTAEVEVFFKKAGLERAVGGTSGGPGEVEDFDQVWTTAGLDTHNSAQVETDGVSDHPHAGYTEIS